MRYFVVVKKVTEYMARKECIPWWNYPLGTLFKVGAQKGCLFYINIKESPPQVFALSKHNKSIKPHLVEFLPLKWVMELTLEEYKVFKKLEKEDLK